MNKYLITVFCLITGCAATVPQTGELTVEYQRFAEWYAGHAQNLDGIFAPAMFGQTGEEHAIKERCPHPVQLLLIKKLFNKLAAPKPNEDPCFCQFSAKFFGIPQYLEVFCSPTPKGGNQIRAPGTAC